MSSPSAPLTYENLLELFRETREQFQEIARRQEETSLQIKKPTGSFKK